MLAEFLEKRKFDETYGFAVTRNFWKKIICCSSGDFFFSSAADGRGSVADNYVGVVVQDELKSGEILFFSKEKSEL